MSEEPKVNAAEPTAEIRILRLNSDKTRKDTSSADTYHVYFELSGQPSSVWRSMFEEEWKKQSLMATRRALRALNEGAPDPPTQGITRSPRHIKVSPPSDIGRSVINSSLTANFASVGSRHHGPFTVNLTDYLRFWGRLGFDAGNKT